MKVTPSARTELLEAVARLQRRDPDEAVRFVDEVEERLVDLAGGLDDVPELRSPKHSATASSGHRLFVRERTDGVWLIAVWPERSIRERRPRTPNSPVDQ